jgi:hypothetical protein
VRRDLLWSPSSRRPSRLVRPLLAVLAGTLLALAPISASTASASQSSDGDLLISADGVSYSSQFTGTLFGGGAVLVPQDSLTANFSVRNATNRQARLRVALIGTEVTNPDIANSFVVAAAVESAPPRATTLDGSGGCSVVIDNVVLAPKQSTQIVTMLTLEDLPGVVGQGERASMRFNLTLMDAAAPAPAETCTLDERSGTGGLSVSLLPGSGSGSGDVDGALPGSDTSSGGASPGTGIRRVGIVSDDMLPLLMLVAFFAGGGLFWLRFRRRQRTEEQAAALPNTDEPRGHAKPESLR